LAPFPVPGYEDTVFQTEGRLITITLSALKNGKKSHFRQYFLPNTHTFGFKKQQKITLSAVFSLQR